jgi:uncharacterized protein
MASKKPPSFSEIDASCGSCGASLDRPLRCSGCQSVSYCGEACQRRHWKESHKKDCKVIGGDSFLRELRRAEAGIVASQFNVGTSYYHMVPPTSRSSAIHVNARQAVRWLRVSAFAGFARAQFLLSLCYEDGTGVPRDAAEALRLMLAAADGGFDDAMFNLGLRYAEGCGVTRDDAEAARWWRKAATVGCADAQVNLGAFCMQGRGVSRDVAEALRLWRSAAAQGDAEAIMNLASHGVPLAR